MSKHALLFVAAAMVAACGGGGEGVGIEAALRSTPATQITRSTDSGTAKRAIDVGMRCSEIAGFFPVDYATARSLVPPEYEVIQLPTGQALMNMPIQDCSELVLDGSDVGAAPVVHFWIQVAGPEEYVEVAPGAVAKRDYYYSVFMHTTASDPVRQPVKQLGFEGTPIQSMTLGEVIATTDGYSVRQGGVVEKAPGNGKAYGYGWQEQLIPNAPFQAAVVHSFYHTKNDGKKGEADARCLVSVNGTGYAQLTVDPRSEAAVFGTALAGQTMDVTMQCDVAMSQVK